MSKCKMQPYGDLIGKIRTIDYLFTAATLQVFTQFRHKGF